MNYKCNILLLLFLATTASVQAQIIGGNSAYKFLELDHSARSASLGGGGMAIFDDDVSQAYANPSLYNPSMHNQLAISNELYFGGINHTTLVYAHSLDSITTAGLSMKYVSYGDFIRANAQGNTDGVFTANESVISLGISRQYCRYTYGLNLKYIGSSIESYSSIALAADLAINYHVPIEEFTISIAAKNIGLQLRKYQDTNEPLPFDLQLGLSKRLKYLPLRLNVLAHTLYQWDIRYDDPALQVTNIFFNEEDPNANKNYTVDKLFRHLTFSGEFYMGKVLTFRFGYNYQRRKEMILDNLGSMAGISFGGGLKIRNFQLNYGRAIYHLAGSANHFSLNINLSDFKKKTRQKKGNKEM